MPLNTENINNKDFNNICRICMINCDVKFFRDNVISNVYHKLTNIHFETNDELPQQICLKCFEKINEIHEFTFQCKRTHSTLTNCLKNFKKTRLNEEQDITKNTAVRKKYELVIKLEKTITVGKHKIGVDEDEHINSTNNEVSNELQEIENILENTSNESNEDLIPETSETNDGQIINCSSKRKPFYKSKQCPKSFDQSPDLKRHMRTHRDECVFKSDPTLKSSTQSSNLKKHIPTHKRKCQFKCDQCSKLFHHYRYMRIHMRVHSGERPYKCNQCSKSCITSSNLKVHMRTHSGERPYKCKQCSKSFAQHGYLKTHMRTHNGERPYTCKICLKSYITSSNLKTHMRTHS